MKHLGDITNIDWANVEPVDVVTGGSPCQDLSIAGKRAGLAGDRSGLYMEQIKGVKELRKADEQRGRTDELCRPRFMVWENVHGAFSSNKGADFAAVLTEAVRVVEPEAPDVPVPAGGWPYAGELHDGVGGRWSIAWRTHDAQYWGVPQRRRRISLICDFGGMDAAKILFEYESLHWGSSPIAKKGKEVARDSGMGTEGARHHKNHPKAVNQWEGNTASSLADAGKAPSTYALRIRSGCPGGGQGALVQTEKSGTLGTGNDQTIFCFSNPFSLNTNLITRCNKIVHGTGLVAGFKGHQGVQACGVGFKKEKMPTLSATQKDAVLVLNDQGGSVMDISEDVVATLRAQSHGHEPLVFAAGETGIGYWQPGIQTLRCSGERPGSPNNVVVVLDARGNGDESICPTITGDHESRITDYTALCIGNGQCNQAVDTVAKTLNCMHSQQIVLCIDCRNHRTSEVSGTIQAKDNGGQSLNYINPIIVLPADNLCNMVRRLTPLECERLQEYPDGWTDIGDWVDSKGKNHKGADGPRYKAIGNSIALPFWRKLLKRISSLYDCTPTLGSLFDGIGGFPLCWEQINGTGTARWASEIEEFPIAVTKKHFPEVEHDPEEI